MKIILLSPTGIGDVICSLIVGNACSSVADVSYVVPQDLAGLFDGTGFREIYRNDLPRDQFDLLIDLWSSHKSNRNIVRKIRAREKIGRARGKLQRIYYTLSLYHATVEKYPTGHIVYDYKQLLDYLDLPLASTTYLSHRGDSPSACGNYVRIHIGAKNTVRYLPVDLIVRCCRYFSDRHIPVRLIGTEKGRADEIRTLTAGYPTYERGDLRVVKTWLSNALLTIAPDSGIFHLASALGGKTLGIYGQKPYARTGSINPNATAIEGDCACRREKRNVRHPYRDVRCPYNSRCLREIPFETVQHKIETLLQSPDGETISAGERDESRRSD